MISRFHAKAFTTQISSVFSWENSEVKQTQIYDARLCTSNQEKILKQKTSYPNS